MQICFRFDFFLPFLFLRDSYCVSPIPATLLAYPCGQDVGIGTWSKSMNDSLKIVYIRAFWRCLEVWRLALGFQFPELDDPPHPALQARLGFSVLTLRQSGLSLA